MIIEELKRKQVEGHLTDQQFAERLGIHRVRWNGIKNGHISFGKTFLIQVRQSYPDLRDAIDIFLTDGITGDKKAITPVTTNTHQAHQDRRGGVFMGLSIIQYLVSLVKRLKKPTK